MNNCFICDTPYQLLNCINICYHYNKKVYGNLKKEYSDIYVGKHFHKCKEIVKNLKENKIFDNVYLYEFPKYKGKVDFLFKKFNEVFFTHKSLQNWTDADNIFDKKYDRIYMSIYTHFSFALQEINPNAKIYFYDDGTGTYLGKTQKPGFKKRKIIYKITNKHFPLLEPETIYVNNKKFYLKLNGKNKININQLPKLDSNDKVFLELLYKIFGFTAYEEYDRKNIIFLTQPNNDNIKNFDKIEKSVLDILFKYKDKVLLRVHPRQSALDYSGFDEDKARNLWELISLIQLNNNHVLIGTFSTAQIIPKIIYDKEPWLIFIYPLFKNAYNQDIIYMIKKTVNALKNIYSKKNKVIVIYNLQELEKIMYNIATM